MLDRLFKWFYWKMHPEKVAQFQALVDQCRREHLEHQRNFIRELRETLEDADGR